MFAKYLTSRFAALLTAAFLATPTHSQTTTSNDYPTRDMTESAEADARDLRRVAEEALARILGSQRYADEITLRFLGNEPLGEELAEEPDDAEPEVFGYGYDRGEAVTHVHAFNPDTRNAFEIGMPRSLIRLIGETNRRRGNNDGTPGPLGGPPVNDPLHRHDPVYEREGSLGHARIIRAAWSNNSDQRFRYSSTLSATTSWPFRAIAHFSNNCSGTFFGPQHVVTAGHCIYSRRNSRWNAISAITPGRAGGNFNFGQVGIPQAGFNWYFTPSQWRTSSGSTRFQYDFGILIVADRLADQTGAMGYFIGSDSFLRDSVLINRGYPTCNTANRIDEPGDPGSNVVCLSSHLYGDPFDCEIGNFGSEDDEGWTRRFSHSCDASAGQSGSPVYLVRDGIVYIVGVHTRSLCGKTNADTPCTSEDDTPLVATRITPEYADWMSYFREWRP